MATEVVGADPEGSLYSGGPVHSYRVEGIGEDFWPDTLHQEVIDRYITVSDRDSFIAGRRLVAREGLFAGGSSGTAIWAAVQIARELHDPEALVVTLLPDGGRPYLSKVFNDHWMREHGYLAGGGRTAGDLLEAKRVDGALVTVSSHDEVGRALALMQQHGVSQVPVVSAEDESVFVGVVRERGLLWASAEHPGILRQEMTEVLEPPLPELAPEDPAEDAIRAELRIVGVAAVPGAREGPSPGDGVVERRPKPPDVRGCPDLLPETLGRALLGCHVRVGANRFPHPLRPRGATGDAQVDQSRRHGHDDVVGLDVEVHDVHLSHVVESAREAQCERKELLRG